MERLLLTVVDHGDELMKLSATASQTSAARRQTFSKTKLPLTSSACLSNLSERHLHGQKLNSRALLRPFMLHRTEAGLIISKKSKMIPFGCRRRQSATNSRR